MKTGKGNKQDPMHCPFEFGRRCAVRHGQPHALNDSHDCQLGQEGLVEDKYWARGFFDGILVVVRGQGLV